MNKEFLDPNTKYSDQKVDLAKMPGLVGELDARITALEEGGGGGGGTVRIIDIKNSAENETLQATYNQIVAWVRAGDTLIAKDIYENAFEPQEGITQTDVVEKFSLFTQYYTSTVTTTPTPGEHDGTVYNVDFAGIVYTSNDPDTFMINEGGD